MKIYYVKTDSYNEVVITDGETAKVYTCAPNGTFEGIDLYAENASFLLKAYFRKEMDDLEVYENMWCENGEMAYRDVADLLEGADLVYSDEGKRERYLTRDRKTGLLISAFDTVTDAMLAIERYEQLDREDGIYHSNMYEIYDTGAN